MMFGFSTLLRKHSRIWVTIRWESIYICIYILSKKNVSYSLVNQDALKNISSIAGGLFPGMRQFQSETPFISEQFEILNKTYFSFIWHVCCETLMLKSLNVVSVYIYRWVMKYRLSCIYGEDICINDIFSFLLINKSYIL